MKQFSTSTITLLQLFSTLNHEFSTHPLLESIFSVWEIYFSRQSNNQQSTNKPSLSGMMGISTWFRSSQNKQVGTSQVTQPKKSAIGNLTDMQWIIFWEAFESFWNSKTVKSTETATQNRLLEFKYALRTFFEQIQKDQASTALKNYVLALKESECSPATLRNYRSDINQFIRFSSENSLRKLITKPKIAAFLENEAAKGLTEASIRRKRTSISLFAQWLTQTSWLSIPEEKIEEITEQTTQIIQAVQPSFSVPRPAQVVTNISQTTATALKPEATVLPVIQQEVSSNAAINPQYNRLTQIIKQDGTQVTKQLTRPNPKKIWKKISFQARQALRSSATILSFFNFGLLLVFLLGLGWFGYQQLQIQTPEIAAYPSALTSADRVLSFQGRLTDSLQNPITATTAMKFRLYNVITGGTALWDSGTCNITPDQDGIFNAGLGDSCGLEIGSAVFSENPAMFLEVEIATEVLAPRQPIRTVAYAINSETLQGFPPADPAMPNNVLILNNSGDLNIGSTSPNITSTVGTFTLEGVGLTLQTGAASNGDITLAPDGTGTVNISSELEVAGSVRLGAVGVNNVLNTSSTGIGNDPTGSLYWGNRELVDTTNISAFGVSSITGTANQITASASIGAITLSLPSDLRAPGTFNAVTSIATGAGAGTTRIDVSGNLSNIGTIDSTYLTTSTNVVNLVGASTALQMNGVETITNGRLGRFANGTDGAPAYSFSGDTNSGFFSAAADQLGISTAGVERMRINDSGNVGIGTTTPGAYRLNVSGTGIFSGNLDIASTITLNTNGIVYGTGIANKSTENNAYLNTSATGLIGSRNIGDANPALTVTQTHASSTGDIARFNNSAGTQLVITQAGNLGVGMTPSGNKLDVNGAFRTNGAVTLSGLSTDTQTTALMINGSNQLSTRALGSLAFSSALSFLNLSDTPGAYTSSSQYVVRVNTAANALEFVDPSIYGGGSSNWQRVVGNLSPLITGDTVSATASAGTVATFTSTGTNNALRAGGTTQFVAVDQTGNLSFTNGSGSTISASAGLGIDASGTLTIGGTNQTGLTLGRTGVDSTLTGNITTLTGATAVRVSNLATNGVVFTSGTNGTLNSEAQLAIARGGTNGSVTPTAGAIAYGTGSAYGFSSAGTANQLLTSGGTGVPTFENISSLLTAGTDISLTGTTNATINNTSTLQSVTTRGASSSNAVTLSATGNALSLSGTGANIAFTGAGLAQITTASNQNLALMPGGTGMVGIGTATPSEALDVTGAVRLGAAGVNNVLNTSAAAGAPTGNLFWGNRTLADSSNIGSYAVSSITGTANQITASASIGNVTLSLPADLRAPGTFNAVTSIATGAGAGTVRIDVSGNLTNIGTISSTYLATSTNVVNLVGASTAFQMNGTETITSGRLARLADGSATTPSFSFTNSTNTGLYYPGSNGLAASTNGTQRMIITSDGYVGFGTSTPGWLLDVAGSASIANNLITQTEGGLYYGRVEVTQNQLALSDSSFGVTWEAQDSTRDWREVAMSSNGKYQTAGVQSGQIYTSSDYGDTWTAQDSGRVWNGIAMSSDGKYQSATVSTHQIYTSSDYGDTWTAQDSNRSWVGIAMSSDGKYQSAVVLNGQIYTSSDYGDNWTAQDSTREWRDIAMSSDGKYQSAVANNGQIYTSSDYGDTWTAQDSTRNWRDIAMSSDGKFQSAVVLSGQIYTSSDYGDNWTTQDSSRDWATLTMSASGKYQAAVVSGGQIYTSIDYGDNWTAQDSTRDWRDITMSSDGKYLTTTVGGGQIYTSTTASYLASGNFGIGVENPTAKLSIAGSSSTISNTAGDITIDAASGIVSFSGDSITNFSSARAADGSAALPAFSFTSDTTSGMFYPGANGLAFSSNGVERMRFTSAGHVGFGTTTPLAKFTVEGATIGKALAIFNETGNQDIIAASASGNLRFRVDTNGYTHAQRFVDLANSAYFLDPAATDVSLTVAGKVGIGSTAPAHFLQVTGSVVGKALSVFNYTGTDQNILVASNSGALRFSVGHDGLTTVNGNATISGTLTAGIMGKVNAGTCTTAREGQMYYNKNLKEYLFCNGTEWMQMSKGRDIEATGGTITEYTGNGTTGINGQRYKVHTFTSSSTLTLSHTPTQGLQGLQYLVVGGGGGGTGGLGGGGGGAGGVARGTIQPIAADSYTVTVGAGGAATLLGGNSVLGPIIGYGGGYGGSYGDGSFGIQGGSGGGDGRDADFWVFSYQYNSFLDQGFRGGRTAGSAWAAASGGGGAGAAGGNGSASNGAGADQSVGGAGGVGISSLINGTATNFAGGGGGAAIGNTGGVGGAGGGGAGGTSGNGTAGTANTGGGGGGGGNGAGTAVGGAGGSGVVIVRYPIDESPGADVAEWYISHDLTVEEADLVAIDPLKDVSVTKTRRGQTGPAIGVVSTKPGLVLGKNDGTTPGVQTSITGEEVASGQAKAVPVALTGRVPIKLSLENGPIYRGDPITTSSIPGVGAKALSAGPIIGYALEEYTTASASESAQVTEYLAQSSEDTTETTDENEDQSTLNNQNIPVLAQQFKRVMVFIQPSSYIPDSLAFSTNGEIILEKVATQSALPDGTFATTESWNVRLSQVPGAVIDAVGVFSRATIGTLQAGSAQIAQITTQLITGEKAQFQELTALDLTVQELSADKTTIDTAKINAIATDTITSLNSNTIDFVLPDPADANTSTNSASLLGDLNESATPSALRVLSASGSTLAQIDSNGNASFVGQLRSQSARIQQLEGNLAQFKDIKAQTANLVNATVSGTLFATDIDGFQDKVAKALEEPSLLAKLFPVSQNQSLGNFTNSGSLSLNDITAISDGSFSTNSTSLTYSDFVTTAASSSASIKRSLASLDLGTDSVVIGGEASFINRYFQVNGSAHIGQSLGLGGSLIADGSMVIGQDATIKGSAFVADTLMVGNSIQSNGTLTAATTTIIGDGYIAYVPVGGFADLDANDDTNSDATGDAQNSNETSEGIQAALPLSRFEIQPSGRGMLSLMAGLLTLDETGQVIISGDVFIAGKLTVADTLLTDLMQPTDFTNPFQIKLATRSGQLASGADGLGANGQVAGATTEGQENQVTRSRFEIIDELGTPVATISANGRASFQAGIGIGRDSENTATGEQINTSKTTGIATLSQGSTGITIFSDTVTPDSLIYISPLGPTDNQVLYVKNSIAPTPEVAINGVLVSPAIKGQFTIGFQGQATRNVRFNWWIVN